MNPYTNETYGQITFLDDVYVNVYDIEMQFKKGKHFLSIEIDGMMVPQFVNIVLAKRDGFSDVKKMHSWFKEKDFKGKLISWGGKLY